MKKICAVTGAGGYVGGAIADWLERNGWEVRRLSRSGGDVTFRLGDKVAKESLADVSALVHAAYDFETRDAAVNVEGTRKLFAAATAAGVKRMVLISTMSAYDGCQSVYGQTKLAMERLAREHGALSVRSGLVWSNEPGGMMGQLTERARRGGWMPIVGEDVKLYLVHQDDLSRLVAWFIDGDKEASTHPMTAANGKPWRLQAIVEMLAARAGKKIHFVSLPWKVVWVVLRGFEKMGVKLKFRSDSLVSLMHQNRAPNFARPEGISFREF